MNLPSKELLTDVLNVHPIVEMEYEFDNDYSTYFIRTNSGKESTYPYFLIDPTITIVSDLAHKCKEWAIEQGFSITSANSYMGDLQPMAQPVSSNGCEYPWINGVTEPEAIFQACEWILKNTKDGVAWEISFEEETK